MLGRWEKVQKGSKWQWECSMCKHCQDFRTRICEYCKMEMEDGLEDHRKEKTDGSDNG